jgi:hypothetical protein
MPAVTSAATAWTAAAVCPAPHLDAHISLAPVSSVVLANETRLLPKKGVGRDASLASSVSTPLWKPKSLSVVPRRTAALSRRARLVQKIYGRDDATGDVCGIYFFENEEALAAFRETELAQTIPEALEAVDGRREAYDVLYPLWPDRGPLSVDSWIDELELEALT